MLRGRCGLTAARGAALDAAPLAASVSGAARGAALDAAPLAASVLAGAAGCLTPGKGAPCGAVKPWC